MEQYQQFRAVKDKAARDAIPVEERSPYMHVFVHQDQMTYVLYTIPPASETASPIWQLDNNKSWIRTTAYGDQTAQNVNMIIRTTKSGFTRKSFENFCKDQLNAYLLKPTALARTANTVIFRCEVYGSETLDTIGIPQANNVPDEATFMGEATFQTLAPYHNTSKVSLGYWTNFVGGNLGLACISLTPPKS